MINGLGIDLVDIARFERTLQRRGDAFRRKLFTAAEQAWCDRRSSPAASYAARFAAKEAVLKALGTGWSGGIRWTDVEVVRGAKGAVSVKLWGKAAAVAKKKGAATIHLSLTHTDATAGAVAVAASRS